MRKDQIPWYKQLWAKVTYVVVLVWAVVAGWPSNFIDYWHWWIPPQSISALKLEIESNDIVLKNNYLIVTQDRGGLQQNETKGFSGKLWFPLRPLTSFSFQSWEDLRQKHPKGINQFKDKAILSEYYASLKDAQIYINDREQFRITKEQDQPNLKTLSLLTSNVIASLEKAEKCATKVEEFLRSDLNKQWGVIQTTSPATGDTMYSPVTGETAYFVDSINVASGSTVRMKMHQN